jgi:tRNA(Ile)-lysidine synthase
MHRLIRQLWSTAKEQELFAPSERVVVAVSGGPDSVALLLGLYELAPRLGLTLVVAHLDHGLRLEEAAEDAAYVAQLGGRRGLPVEVGNADLTNLPRGENLEEAARRTRYEFLAEVADRHGARTIAVGHTIDDQAETLLMRLLRGAGPRGLSAMTPLASRPGMRVVRPLLRVSRTAVQSYLDVKKEVARLDRTNQDVALTRNRVRHILVPMLRRQFNPRIVETLARTADLMGEVDGYLEGRSQDILAPGRPADDQSADGRTPDGRRRVSLYELRDQGPAEERSPSPGSGSAGGEVRKVELDLPRLASYDRILQRYTLRTALRRLQGDLRGVGYQHIDALVELCRPGARGHRVELPGGATALREGRRLSLWRQPPEPLPAVEPLELPLPGQIEVPGSELTVTTRIIEPPADWRQLEPELLIARFDLDRLEPPLVIRSRWPGDRILGLGLPSETKVKSLLIDARIPRRLREGVPVLTDQRRVLWIAGVRRSAHALLDDDTTQVLEVTLSSPMFSPDRS